MFEKRVNSPEDVERYIEEVSINAVIDGRTIHIDDDAFPIGLDEDTDYNKAYKFTHGMKGDAETIPIDRAAFVTPYTGVYVPSEYRGYSVSVPVRGTREERRQANDEYSLRFYPEPVRFRYYSIEDLTVSDDADKALCLSAVTRAIYEVATGRGLPEEESGAKFRAMEQAAAVYRKESKEKEKLCKELEAEMFRICPELKTLRDTAFSTAMSYVDGEPDMSEFFEALDKSKELEKTIRPEAMNNLGMESDPQDFFMVKVSDLYKR